MTNERVRWFARTDCDLPPHHACRLDRAGIIAGERERLQYRASSFEIASTRLGRNSRGAAVRQVPALSGRLAVESPWALHHPHEEATSLPQWMSGMRPNRAGMFIPGLLAALAILAAVYGILSTVLELAWL